jgi:alpha-tubulin suppressor-like RCC1 family protein
MSGSGESERVLPVDTVCPREAAEKAATINEKFITMRTTSEDLACSGDGPCPATKCWKLGHTIWLTLLLAHLGLATVHAAPEVVAWGTYYNGSAYVPMTVPSGLSNVVAIAAGSRHGLALTTAGQVVAWGTYYNGSAYVPMTVPSGLSNVVAIAAGGGHGLALTAEGRVVGWGGCWDGSTWLPMTVPNGLSNVVAIAAGYVHSLALTTDGRVVAWGWNGYGQTTVPSGLSNVVAIAAGSGHSLALTAAGRVVAWGTYYRALHKYLHTAC